MPPRKTTMEFKAGDQVSAKVAGRYHPGVVARITKDLQYEVQFHDGSVETIVPKDIAKPTSEKRKTRSSSRGRKQSRSRSRSRSRTPGRTKSRAGSKSSPAISRKTNSLPLKPASQTRSSPRINNQNIIKPIELEKKEYPWMAEKTPRTPKGDAPATHVNPPPKANVTTLSWMNIFVAAFLTLLSPVFIFCVNMACDTFQCSTIALPKFPANLIDYFDFESLVIYTGWLAFQILLMLLPLGSIKEGQAKSDGERLTYRLNGFHSFVITTAVVLGLAYYKFPVKIIFDKYIHLQVISTMYAFLISLWLLYRSTKVPNGACVAPLAPPNAIYDFYMGRELNPRIKNFDLKFFIVRRPGLLGWAVLNILMLWTEYTEKSGTTNGLWFVGITQLLYIMDTFYFEEAYLSTWTITTEGLGFMLVFGNLVFIPFMFTLPLRYMVVYQPKINYYFLFVIGALFALGCFIYRGANKMKDDFRRNPYHEKFINCGKIETTTTQRILVDSFWGWCRHPNYLGDLIIGLSWCLPCGFNHVIPYFYFIYLLVTLLHRSRRTDRLCSRKYGNAWNQYCQNVKYRIVPNVY